MIKPPFLVLLDFSAGTVNRYVRRKSYAVAGLGWQLSDEGRAKFEVGEHLDAEEVERFRVTGAI